MDTPDKLGFWKCSDCSFTEWPDSLSDDALATCPNCGEDIYFIDARHLRDAGNEFIVYQVGDGELQKNVKIKCRICEKSIWVDLPAGKALIECGNCGTRVDWYIGERTSLNRHNDS